MIENLLCIAFATNIIALLWFRDRQQNRDDERYNFQKELNKLWEAHNELKNRFSHLCLYFDVDQNRFRRVNPKYKSPYQEDFEDPAGK